MYPLTSHDLWFSTDPRESDAAAWEAYADRYHDRAAQRVAERAAQHARHSPDLNRRIIALATALPEAQGRECVALLYAVADAAATSMGVSWWQQWAGVLAHVPGLASVLERVRIHVG